MLRNFEEQSGLLWTLFILTRATQSRFVLFYSLFHSSQFTSGFPGVRSKHKAARKSPLRPSLDGGPQFPRACTWLVLGGLTQVSHDVMWSGWNKLLCVSNQGIWCFSSAWHMISLNVSFLPSTRQTRGSRSPGLTWGMDCPRLAKFNCLQCYNTSDSFVTGWQDNHLHSWGRVVASRILSSLPASRRPNLWNLREAGSGWTVRKEVWWQSLGSDKSHFLGTRKQVWLETF